MQTHSSATLSLDAVSGNIIPPGASGLAPIESCEVLFLLFIVFIHAIRAALLGQGNIIPGCVLVLAPGHELRPLWQHGFSQRRLHTLPFSFCYLACQNGSRLLRGLF